MGDAYGFFNCRAEMEVIARELTHIRTIVETPREMTLRLEKVARFASREPVLEGIIREAEQLGREYVLIAHHPILLGRAVGKQTVAILQEAYQRPKLFAKNEDFYGDVVFEEDRVYHFHE
jgi:hypothetical protein